MPCREIREESGTRMQSDWPPPYSKALCEYFNKGMSYSAIAKAINAEFKTSHTRNAVLGRATRMGHAATGRRQDRAKSVSIAEAPRLPRIREQKALHVALRTKLVLSSFTERAPHCCMAARVSLRTISSTRSTPSWPKAPNPHR